MSFMDLPPGVQPQVCSRSVIPTRVPQSLMGVDGLGQRVYLYPSVNVEHARGNLLQAGAALPQPRLPGF